MIRKYFLITTTLTILILFIGCSSKALTEISYQGKSQNWESSMVFNENDKYLFNLKYIGEEKLPIDIIFEIEYLSSNKSKGVLKYTEGLKETDGFAISSDYDKQVYGAVSQSANIDILKVTIEWNNKEESIELKKE